LVREPHAKSTREIPKRKEDNIKVNLRDVGY